MTTAAREWNCDYCGDKTLQGGPRGADVLPTPPIGWTMVDLTTLQPPRTVDGHKMGEARRVMRLAVCPRCSGRLAPLMPVDITQERSKP